MRAFFFEKGVSLDVNLDRLSKSWDWFSSRQAVEQRSLEAQ